MRNSSLREGRGRREEENSGDFRKRLHKRAHLNFSNSPAFHFPDGRSFVRTTRLLRALVSFAGFPRLTMAAAPRLETFEESSPRRRDPPSFDIFLSYLFPSSSQMSRRRELSRCELGLKLFPYIRSSFSTSGVVNRTGDLALVVWSSPSSVLHPIRRYHERSTLRNVQSLSVLFFE